MGEFVGGRPFGVEVDFHLNQLACTLAEALGEQEGPGVIFVFAWPVARSSGNHDDTLLLGGDQGELPGPPEECTGAGEANHVEVRCPNYFGSLVWRR
jgi:hypothetical protein